MASTRHRGRQNSCCHVAVLCTTQKRTCGNTLPWTSRVSPLASLFRSLPACTWSLTSSRIVTIRDPMSSIEHSIGDSSVTTLR